MKKFIYNIGILLIILGTLILLMTYFHVFTRHNTILATGLLLIVLGIIAHIWNLKHESKY